MNQPTAITDIRRDLVALLPRLRRFALTMATSASEADDLVREVCAKAIQKSHHWKGEGRGGSANNALTKLVQSKKLKRLAVKGERGSKYSIA